jgi:MFS family permease
MSHAVSTAPRPAAALSPGAWSAVVLLWFAGGSNYLARTMLTTMRGSIVADIPMSDAQFGLLTSGFLWIYALANPIGGFLADRFSRKSVIVGSLIAWSLVTACTAYARTFEQFLALRMILGISEAFYIPAAISMIVDFHRGPTRGLAAGIHTTGLIFGSTIGGLGGWIAEHHNWNVAYSVIGVPSLILGFTLFFFLREPAREHPASVADSSAAPSFTFWSAVARLAKTGPLYWVLVCWGLQGAVGWLIIGWMPTHMREQFNMGQGAAGFSALGYVYVFQTLGLLAGGHWSDRWSQTFPRARIVLPSVAFMLTAPTFLITGQSDLFIFTVLALAGWGLAEGFLGANMMPIICFVVDQRYRATAYGVLNAFPAIFGGISIWLGGVVRDAQINLNVILIYCGVGVFVCGASLWMVNRHVRRLEASAAKPGG